MLSLDAQLMRIAAAATRRTACITAHDATGQAIPEPAAAFADVSFELVETLDALDRLGDDWTALQARVAAPHQVFQSYGFCRTWARAWLGQQQAACRAVPLTARTQRLAILTARRRDRLIMVWPLVRQSVMGLEILTWLGQPVAQYGDVLVEQSPDTLALLRHAWRLIVRRLSPDIVRLRKVRADAAVNPLLDGLGAARAFPQQAPAVTLLAGGAASLDQRQCGKARKNRRRLGRRLAKLGTVTFAELTSTTVAAAIAIEGLTLKRRWLAERCLHSAAFADPRLDHFFATAASQPETTGCRVFALSLDGQPIAIAIGFSAGRHLALHMISYDLNHERAGVGVLNIEAVLRHCEAAGYEAVDFLAPNADYKMVWANTTVEVADRIVAVTAKGTASMAIFDGLLLPVARSALEKALPGMRRGVRGLATAARRAVPCRGGPDRLGPISNLPSGLIVGLS